MKNKQRRNDTCHCGSGAKYKKCCGAPSASSAQTKSGVHEAHKRRVFCFSEGDEGAEEMDFAALMMGLMEVPPSEFEKQCPDVVKALKAHNPIASALAFASLMTSPDLQSNFFRLEALVFISLVYGNGDKVPLFATLQEWFQGLESTYVAYEDPAEDVFSSIVSTQTGNYRIFAGVDEANAFYLQRILNVIEGTPRNKEFDILRGRVAAMLRISEEVAERLGIDKYELGQLLPLQEIPPLLSEEISRRTAALRFTSEDLESLNISEEDLAPFLFSFDFRNELLNAESVHSGLGDTPLIVYNNAYYVLLPSSIGVAIRRYVVGYLSSKGFTESFERALVRDYQKLLINTSVLGRIRIQSPLFTPINGGYIAKSTFEIDPGKFLQLIFFIDNVGSFNRDHAGNTVSKKKSVAFENLIAEDYKILTKESDFRSGLSLIIGCGWGRPFSYERVKNTFEDWEIDYISCPDLITLSWRQDFDPLVLFRISNAVKNMKDKNIDIINVNGLLNLCAYIEHNQGRILPDDSLPEGFGEEDHPNGISIEPFDLAIFRQETLINRDYHHVLNENGHYVQVAKESKSHFKEDLVRPLYVNETDILKGRLRAVFENGKRYWWVEVINFEDPGDNDAIHGSLKMLQTWLSRVVPVVESHLDNSLPKGVICWKVYLSPINESALERLVDEEELRANIHFSVDKNKNVITLELNEKFGKGFSNPLNIAERIIVEKFIHGILVLSECEFSDEDIIKLVKLVVTNTDARLMHALRANSFRDFIHETLAIPPIFINAMDDEAIHLGMCWDFSERGKTATIEGKDQCKEYLNALVKKLESDLCIAISVFDREDVVQKLLLNHEYSAFDKAIWRRTSKAMLALHTDREQTFTTILEHDHKLSTSFLASRVLIELALCECKLKGGQTLGILDATKLMSKVISIVNLGEWSNLIHFDCMKPLLKITPTGDIRADVSFVQDVVRPYSAAGNKRQIVNAIEKYEDLFSEPEFHDSVHEAFDSDFLQAWQGEMGFSIDEVRVFIDLLENIGIEKKEAVLKFSRSALYQATDKSISRIAVAKILENLTSFPRPGWHTIPEGYVDADRQPWRFRRRFSLLRRPLVQLSEAEDPMLLIAPGLLREGFIYTLSHYHDGDFQVSQATTKKMRSWFGKIADKNGKDFNDQVENKMREMGWQVKPCVNITEIFGVSLDIDYGDIDVLAWNVTSGRILVMECKDLKFSKTPRELAEQLYKFKGEGASANRDTLKRHLDRIELLQRNPDILKKYLELPPSSTIEGHLVFKNIVPMQFAWDHMSHIISLSIYDELSMFSLRDE